jgi:hypothetical protein
MYTSLISMVITKGVHLVATYTSMISILHNQIDSYNLDIEYIDNRQSAYHVLPHNMLMNYATPVFLKCLHIKLLTSIFNSGHYLNIE